MRYPNEFCEEIHKISGTSTHQIKRVYKTFFFYISTKRDLRVGIHSVSSTLMTNYSRISQELVSVIMLETPEVCTYSCI